MTAPLEGATSPPRSQGRLVKVALALSLVLNVFFVGGLVYSKFVQPAPLVALGRQLNLEPDQRKAFQSFLQVVRRKGAALRDTNSKVSAQIWEELSQPKPDEQKLTALFTEVATNRHEYQMAVGSAIIPFLETLTSEQRARFVEISKRRQDAMAGRLRQLLQP